MPRRLIPASFLVSSLLLLLTAVAPTPARADQLEDIRHRGELVVGVLGTDEPHSFVDPATRELVGYEVDLARAVAQRIGVKVSFKQLAVAARIPELQQGRVDLLAASLTHNRERESQIDFSLTEFVTGQRVMVRADSGVSDLAQLAGHKVLTVKGGTQEPNIRKAVPGVEVVTFETAQQAFLALRQGKGVGYVNDEVSLMSDYAKLGPARKDFVVLPANIGLEHLALGLRKGEPALKTLVDEVLRGLEASGAADRLFMKWCGPGTKLNLDHRGFRIDSDRI